VKTVISSTPPIGPKVFNPPSVPFTGTFMATAANNTGPTGYESNVASSEELYSVPYGTWTLAMKDDYLDDKGNLIGWVIEFDYSVP
jgi:hypothetical protein